MSRYIDADNLPRHGNRGGVVYWRDIEAQPTADVVKVVRCKDCKWYRGIGCAIKIVDESDEPTDNDFCSYGERAEE